MFLKNIFRKYKNINNTGNESCLRTEFEYSMDFVRGTLEHEKEEQDKIIILDFMLDVIRNDLQYDVLTTILYSSECFSREINFLFPIYYYDELGNKFNTYPNEKTYRNVDLSKDCILVIPWDRERLRNSIKNIFRNEFEYHDSNHLSYYFTHIDICHAYNGLHSISAGVGHKKGFIKAVECDISKLFNHIYTDGESWYNCHNNDKLDDVFDFRVAILYELAKIKYNLTNYSL